MILFQYARDNCIKKMLVIYTVYNKHTETLLIKYNIYIIMKKINVSTIILMSLSFVVMSSCMRNNGEVYGEYVDLGLSSGTKWKTVNERNSADVQYGFFTFYEAFDIFGDKLPNINQWTELVNECNWIWTGMGYRVVGPNGKCITLPASGARNCDEVVGDVGTEGYYWSSTASGPSNAWCPYFDSREITMDNGLSCSSLSVRLVQQK